MKLQPNETVYLGDAVYLTYTGYDWVLRTGSHDNPTMEIYLEPSVMKKLIEYVKEASEMLTLIRLWKDKESWLAVECADRTYVGKASSLAVRGRGLVRPVDVQEALKEPVWVKGVRTTLYTGIEKQVTLKLHVFVGHNEQLWIQCEGGPTGFESCHLEFIQEGRDWLACAGTMGSWDRLLIPHDELRKVWQ